MGGGGGSSWRPVVGWVGWSVYLRKLLVEGGWREDCRSWLSIRIDLLWGGECGGTHRNKY